MKTITISNSLYGALWSCAKEDDQSEEDILRRLLAADKARPNAKFFGEMVQLPASVSTQDGGKGYYDRRFGVYFPPGFEVFRTYKGKDFRAYVSDGKWQLEGHMVPLDTLSALSAKIGAQTENAWMGWRYKAKDGSQPFISELRDPSKIVPRGKSD
ncbi:MAG: hypothetical protein P4M02_03620 [Clostridia bacterium]|nr:hypothetical protein [Clostridia bacterium]